ncbi:hypothetical protein O6H91_01G153000 [Diphasiastrum complanatum]|uniref:Uncharacterized protein n=1 Tax=Diphasiastrum complanatum TaxID=34168 RepID=A0ACC2EXM7_DIPCM|nr:hypothetical protein O6H91_01G153000 [Diphasiastrum complanatum]
MRSFAGFAVAKFCTKKRRGKSDLSSTASRITSFLGDLPHMPLLLLHSHQHQASSTHRRCYSQAAVLKEDTAEAEAAPNASPSPSPREVLWAIPRVDSGSIISGKERKAGRVPSVVFEQENGHLGGNKQLISVNTKQISRILKQIGVSFFHSRLYDLEIHSQAEGGEVLSKEVVLPRLLHLHAGTDEILNVTFIRAPPHARLRVNVPLVYLGEDACPGIRKDHGEQITRR